MNNKHNTNKWYGNKTTLIALITGFISSTLSLINVLIAMSK